VDNPVVKDAWATIDEMPAVVPSPDQLPIFEELAVQPARRRRPHLRIQPPLLADLTARQRKAVTHADGPLLIVAGAGTGKTTVITRRIAWLIAEKRAKPSEILALTFTDRAALEMTERVDRLVPYGYTDTVISTFHAFGDRLLRDHALEAGLSDRSTVLSRAEQVIFLREHLFELPLDRYRPLGDPTRFLHALVTLISRARDEDVLPADYRTAAQAIAARLEEAPFDEALAEEAAQQAELAALYEAYEELMRANDRLDFGDQVSLALRILREHPAVLEAERARFKYILVDEFQDTNYAQFELVKLLAGSPRANVTVVGDDDQSIYRFRGAALSNILGFRAAFPKAASVVLNDNFRSRQPILDAAYRLIQHNDPDRLEAREGLDKRLVARARFARPAPADGPIALDAFEKGSDEADAVAERIAASLRAGRSAGDHAVLVRTNRDAEPLLRAFNMARVPWRFSGTAGLYHQPEVRLLLSFLRAVNDPADSVACYDLATSEIFELDARDVTLALNAATRRRTPLESALRQAMDEGDRPFAGRARETVQRLLSSLDQHRTMSAERGSGELLYHFVTSSGWLGRLARQAREGGDERLANVARFFEIVRRQAALLRDDRLPFLVAQLDTLIEAGDDPSTADVEPDTGEAVHVLTYHKAKGLEFPIVHMVGLVDDRFPTRSRGDLLPLPAELVREPLPDGDHHLAEERRLFYVGMTRAREELHLSWARDYGNRVARRMSPYLLEALDLPPATPADTVRTSTLERLARNQRPAAAPPTGAARPSLGDRQLRLSYGQISDYLDCPTRYRYAHVIGIPTAPSHQMAYGRALHAAVQAFHRRQLAGEPASREELHAELDAAWESVGFLTRQHEEARKAAAHEALDRFWDGQQADPARPIAVEEEFSVLLGRDRVRGRYDRVDRDDDGRVVITDYKSADVRDPATASRRARDSLQLSIYALAYEAQHGKLPDELALHFLESGIVGRATPTPRRLARAAEQVTTVSEGIRAGAFEPNPSPMRCGFCPFREICPDAAR
jgi:DNA helicase-2/ATP-dependent DNA helicase PcrA